MNEFEIEFVIFINISPGIYTNIHFVTYIAILVLNKFYIKYFVKWDSFE